jgi:hypothetical protein
LPAGRFAATIRHVPDQSALERPVFVGGEQRPFGELTLAEVEELGAELAGASGLGHRSRVGAVAAGWRDLAAAMRDAGARRVADLDAESTAAFAERLWIVPPEGGLLQGGATEA